MSTQQQAIESDPLKNAVFTSKEVPQPVTLKPVPRLPAHLLAKAQALAEQIDPDSTQQVLMLGDGAQSKNAELSSRLLKETSVAESGKTGELLLNLQKTVKDINPEALKGPQTFIAKLINTLPFTETIEDRITDFKNRHEAIEPVLNRFENMLRLEQEKVSILSEQTAEKFLENRNNRDNLEMVKVALVMASNKAALDYEAKRKNTPQDADFREISDLKKSWDNIQRVDRKLYAIEASIALAYTNEAQIARIKEMFDYNAEVLNEARQVMLPVWKTKIHLAIWALESKDQVEVIEAFRKMTDDMLDETANLIQEVEGRQADMQKRTFVAAEVIARVNAKMADGITTALQKQIEAKVARDEGLKVIAESQEKLLTAMRDAGNALVQTSGLNISNKPSNYDIAAGLLENSVN